MKNCISSINLFSIVVQLISLLQKFVSSNCSPIVVEKGESRSNTSVVVEIVLKYLNRIKDG